MTRRACPNSPVTFVEFMDKRNIIAIRPEELAVRELQESRHQVSNFNLEIDVELSPAWKRIFERAGCAETTLTTSEEALHADDCRLTQAGIFREYLKSLPVRVSLIFEYSNYSIRVASDGQTERVLNRLPAIGPSGFEFKPIQQKMITTKFVELGK